MSETADPRAERFASGALAVLIAGAGAVWLWYGLAGRSITTDDGISLLAAQGIRTHGYPLLGSGYVYDRGYLAHYVLAASTATFGGAGIGVILPSVAAALATLGLVFGLGRRALGNPVSGLLAAALLAGCGAQIYYATSPRFYELLAFCSVWAVHAGWRGYAEGSAAHRWQAILAVALGLQCELGAGTLVLALPIALIASGPAERSLRERVGALLPRRGPEIAAGAALVASVALVSWRPPGHIEFIVAQSGRLTDFVGLNPSLYHAARHLVYFDGLMPGTLPFVLAGFAAALAVPELRRPGLVYAGVIWLVALAQVALVMNVQAHRFLLFLLPIYALLAAHGAVSTARAAAIAWRHRRPEALVPAAALTVAASAGLVSFEHFAEHHATDLDEIYEPGWGLPDDRIDGNLVYKRELLRIRDQIDADDIVLSSNPWITDHYLGHTDGILRQRRTDTGWEPFEVDEDEYFGADVVDETVEIDRIVRSLSPGQSLWMLTDRKFTLFSSKAFQTWVGKRGPQVNKSERIRIIRITKPVVAPRPG